ncbi:MULTISPECIES: hypothetical protein [Nocardia]|uniref:hypothetical protein n=1 Tax=Nocardia TaxID=1817 RepID=UPI001428B9A1|nr:MULTISPECIES: hypothetical protein [Nocardia]MBF6242232.1 hypothetical protein [Nocardia elegans]
MHWFRTGATVIELESRPTLTSVRAVTNEYTDRGTTVLTHLRFDTTVDDAALRFARTALQHAACRVADRGAGGSLVYDIPGDVVAALDISLEGDAVSCYRTLVEVMTSVHHLVPPGAPVLPSLPPWLVRLDHHLRGSGDGPVATLTPEPLREHLTSVVQQSIERSSGLVHGAPSLATTYHTGGGGVVLVGEDLAWGSPETDWGYLLGELEEIAYLSTNYELSAWVERLIRELDDSLRGTDLDHRYICDVAIAKRFTHLADYEQTCRIYGTDLPDADTVRNVIFDLNDLVQ